MLEKRFGKTIYDKYHVLLEDLPVEQREGFSKWMDNKTVLVLEGNRVGFLRHDYGMWLEFLGHGYEQLMD